MIILQKLLLRYLIGWKHGRVLCTWWNCNTKYTGKYRSVRCSKCNSLVVYIHRCGNCGSENLSSSSSSITGSFTNIHTCHNCNGTGKIACVHGKTTAHSYCSHGKVGVHD